MVDCGVVDVEVIVGVGEVVFGCYGDECYYVCIVGGKGGGECVLLGVVELGLGVGVYCCFC